MKLGRYDCSPCIHGNEQYNLEVKLSSGRKKNKGDVDEERNGSLLITTDKRENVENKRIHE